MEQSETKDEVVLRHQIWVTTSVAKAFADECRREKREPHNMLRLILEERYGPGKK